MKPCFLQPPKQPLLFATIVPMSDSNCLFCEYDDSTKNTIIADSGLAYARWDNFPVAEGHAEVVPKRHVKSYFDLTDEELVAMQTLAKTIKHIIDERFHPDAYTIGVNDGEAAGRTVHHVHLHLIPRYFGDVPEPRGGIRHVIPGKGAY